MAEPVIYRTLTDGPGTLHGGASLILHTRQALDLVKGSNENTTRGIPKVTGLIQFSRKLRVVLQAAAADDPTADWMLIRIEEALGKARDHIIKVVEQVEQLLSSRRNVVVTLRQSSAPVKVDFSFGLGSPYIYQLVYVLEDFDRCTAALLTAKHVALMNAEAASNSIRDCKHYIRRVLELPSQWSYQSVSREDIRQNNQRAIRAMKWLAEVPQEVLEGTRRAAFAPRIITVAAAGASEQETATVTMDEPDDDVFPVGIEERKVDKPTYRESR
ncbi:MAG: TIGR03761 family integrating conjugative element protein [Gammaproteobacteria bacterium]|nr:TIGR03761 family integrating conjugative element protein [Gammaproteobacteria bacterium]